MSRVLIVEDDVDAAALLSFGLADACFDVCVAHDGEGALALLARTPADELPDVVLLDLGLPGIDGFEVARRLRAEKEKRARWIIALTGSGDIVQRRRGVQAGIDMHLEKPVAVDEVIDVVADLLQETARATLTPRGHGETLSVFERRHRQPLAGQPVVASDRMLDLARAFPSLSDCPLAHWDAAAFDLWADHACDDGAARHAARFVLSLWNDGWPWRIGHFDVARAVRRWDDAHRAVVIGWTREPWWA